jgi:protein Tex
MKESHISKVSFELSLKEWQMKATAELLDQGATVPFIARYRKEATGSLDEVAIASIRDRLAQLRDLDRRREAILKSLEERGLLTGDLKAKIEVAETLGVLEDLYMPYRPKRRTRASMAREKGLEPLAIKILKQENIDPESEAQAFVNPDNGITSAEEALTGARDILAEVISEDAGVRARVRWIFEAEGVLRSKAVVDPKRNSKEGKEGKEGKESSSSEAYRFKDYADWSEPLSKAPSHRILAMMRGQKEGLLSLHLAPPEEKVMDALELAFIKGPGPASQQVRFAAADGYKRLLGPSMETEIISEIKARADEKAIRVFAENLRHLLLESPAGQKIVLAIDPGFRTGCKMAVMDHQSSLLHHEAIYPHEPQRKTEEAKAKILQVCHKFGVDIIAVGNGTAGRETMAFLSRMELPEEVPVVAVDESGASIYSASEIARDEFPEEDVTVRGAISIGRRLMDPLAELVKIEPKSIGVGQYQHDVDQSALKAKLEDVVRSCVNMVGVDANTASKELLTYVSGLGPKLAEAIVRYRKEHGKFVSRDELRKVPRLGPKAFEQAAGFIRIMEGKNPLDGSAVHPESYHIVERMAGDLGVSAQKLLEDKELQKRIDPKRYVTDMAGMPTILDIISELSKPGRDPRRKFEPFQYQEGVEKPEDLKPGMRLPGIVTNVTAFGAFVDVGVHQDGLVHISQLSDKFVRNPTDIVKVHQRVMVRVLDVDLDRKRITLSMKEK